MICPISLNRYTKIEAWRKSTRLSYLVVTRLRRFTSIGDEFQTAQFACKLFYGRSDNSIIRNNYFNMFKNRTTNQNNLELTRCEYLFGLVYNWHKRRRRKWEHFTNLTRKENNLYVRQDRWTPLELELNYTAWFLSVQFPYNLTKYMAWRKGETNFVRQ